MAAVAFDSLEYAQQLQAVGMPQAQAEVVAKGLTTMFIHNFDSLVTKDYLDTRFSEFETRVDLRFVESESRIDKRFAEFESRIDKRFTAVDTRSSELESRIDKRFTAVDARFSDMETRFARVDVLLGVILLALAIPVLQTLLVWFR